VAGMTVSDLMQAMADAGAPMEAIIIAVRALEEKDAIIAARRAVERDRKRKQRGTVTGQSRDTDGTVAAGVSLDKESPHTPKKIIPSREVDILPACEGLDLPEGVSPILWGQYRAMRRKIRKPLSPLAEQMALKRLRQFAEDGHPPGEIVEAAIAGSYQGLFTSKGQQNGHRKSNPEHEWGRTVAAADEVIAELRAGRAVGG
jgi:hypothetical protein